MLLQYAWVHRCSLACFWVIFGSSRSEYELFPFLCGASVNIVDLNFPYIKSVQINFGIFCVFL